MTMVEAITAIAERFGVEPCVYDCEHEHAHLILDFAWRDSESEDAEWHGSPRPSASI